MSLTNGFDPNVFNPSIIQYQQPRMMVPNPPTISPMGMNRTLEKVNGIESVKQYPMQPNSMVALFDMNDDIFYIKQTDASNYPTIRIFRFYEERDNVASPKIEENYVTMEEFNSLKEELINGQQSIWDAIDNVTKPATAKSGGSSKSKKNDADV